MRRTFTSLLLPALALSACPCARAQEEPPAVEPPAIHRPDASRRIVARFTFDKPEPYDLPRHWDLYLGEQSGGDRRFPAWNTGALDHTVAHRGEGSVRLATSGGSVRLRLDPGTIPVFPETEYLVSAAIRTRGLQHARAAVVARYLDSELRPIAATEVRSRLIISADDEWRKVRFTLPGDVPAAAYLQIDLDVLQPEQYERAILGSHQVWPQDFSGQVWFDDVAVVQLPRVRLTTATPTNIIEAPQKPEISILVRDLSGQPLTGTLTVQDAAGRTIDSHVEMLRAGAASWRWSPRIERFGWYRVVLDLSTRTVSSADGDAPSVHGQRVGATYLDFVWLPERPAMSANARDAAALGLHLSTFPLWQAEHLPTLVRAAGAGLVTIPVWTPELYPGSLDDLAEDMAGSLASLQIGGLQIALSFPELPDQLAAAAQLDSFTPGAVFAQDESLWLPYILPLLDRFGQSVRRWQLGSPGREAYSDPSAAARLRDVLARLVPGPVVAACHPGELGPPAAGVDDLFVTVPWSLPPAAAGEFAEMWTGDHTSGPTHSFLIEPLPEEQFSREVRAAALFKKAVMLWSRLSARAGTAELEAYISCPQPWAWAAEPGSSPMPRVELAVWRTLSQHLAGRRIVGTFPAGEGVFCLILAPQSPGVPGALVAWQSSPAHSPVLNTYLGPGEIVAVDMYGNRSVVPLSAGPAHHIPISTLPMFIEGVDVDLARFVASFGIEPGVLDPRHNEHHATISLSNPWRTHTQGRITIVEPGGLSADPTRPDRSWQILPRILEFSIAPGQTAQLPVRLAFSAMEEHGPKEVFADVELLGQRHPNLRLRGPLEIHLQGLDLDLNYRVINAGGQRDVVVEAIVTNRDTSPATLELTAFSAGYPRARASVSDLAPGASVMRRFSFPKAGALVGNGFVAFSVYNAETGARINRSLRIE